MKNTFCTRCNIEHPDINGLLPNEIVRGYHGVTYRNMTFEIWIVEHPNKHFWGWTIPKDETAQFFNEIAKLDVGYLPFSEGYLMTGYLHRATLETQEQALNDTIEQCKKIIDIYKDDVLRGVTKNYERFKELMEGLNEETKQV